MHSSRSIGASVAAVCGGEIVDIDAHASATPSGRNRGEMTAARGDLLITVQA